MGKKIIYRKRGGFNLKGIVGGVVLLVIILLALFFIYGDAFNMLENTINACRGECYEGACPEDRAPIASGDQACQDKEGEGYVCCSAKPGARAGVEKCKDLIFSSIDVFKDGSEFSLADGATVTTYPGVSTNFEVKSVLKNQAEDDDNGENPCSDSISDYTVIGEAEIYEKTMTKDSKNPNVSSTFIDLVFSNSGFSGEKNTYKKQINKKLTPSSSDVGKSVEWTVALYKGEDYGSTEFSKERKIINIKVSSPTNIEEVEGFGSWSDKAVAKLRCPTEEITCTDWKWTTVGPEEECSGKDYSTKGIEKTSSNEATLTLTDSSFSGKKLCVKAKNKDTRGSFSSESDNFLKIDPHPPIANIKFHPASLYANLSCADGEEEKNSGCKEGFRYTYVSEIDKFLGSVTDGILNDRMKKYCPKQKDKYRSISAETIDYPYSEEIKVMCLRVEDKAGHVAYDAEILYPTYDILRTALEEASE